MFTTIAAFENEWRHESAATASVLAALTDESLAQAVAPEGRTLGRLGWHLATALHEMLSRTGLHFASPGDYDQTPPTAAAIAEGYARVSEAMLEAVRTQWTDADLFKENNLYGDDWPNGLTLAIMIKHEIHHRAQMTVLLRQAGIQPPGLYGPVREEWASFGMEAPAV